METNKELGKKIRNLRKSQKLSLTQLSGKIEKTASYLSQVERGLAEPSITALREISGALGVPMFHFLAENKEFNTVVRKNDRKKLEYPCSKSKIELISPDLNRNMEIIQMELESGKKSTEQPLSHEGEECTLVLEGKMDIKVGDKNYILEPGDSIYYLASTPHIITSIGDNPLVFISAITPPNF